MNKFTCTSCNLTENCEEKLEKGKSPSFVKNILVTEDVYVMKDPFNPPPTGYECKKSLSEYFLILGADCCTCGKPVCKDPKCSFFYAATYCLSCCAQRIADFPLEIQSKIRKQIKF